jgi:hypothetical protein
MRRVIAAVVTAGCAVALVWFAPSVVNGAAQQSEQPAGPAPRMADGHPDLSGVWWGGAEAAGRAVAEVVAVEALRVERRPRRS